jgi:membrane-bound metal-dependent hydrolase YbcI (DUF457 family)
MDFLTHLCLPVTVAYVLYREVFDSPATLLLAGFGLLPDADKFLGMPGMLHSLVTLVPIAVLLLALERGVRGETKYATIAVALAFSHLLLDFVDGGPVPLLFPFVLEGIGLQYPVRTVFGQGLLGLTFEGPLVRLRVLAPRPGYNTYGFIKGAGVASSLAFLAVYLGTERRVRRGPPEGSDSTAETVARPASVETDGETEGRG